MSHKITFRERGQGPLLVLLHGYGGSVQHWENIAQSLSSSYRVIVPNLSHIYMGSDKLFFTVQIEALAKFIRDTFPGEKVSVAGLSYGGALSWGLACQHPHLVHKTVLINPMVTDPVKNFLPVELKFFLSVPLNLKSVYLMLSTPMGKAFLRRSAQIFRDERSGDSAIAVENLKGRKLQFVAHMIQHFSWILRSENWKFWNQKLYKYRGDCRLIFDQDDLLFNHQAYSKFAAHIGCEDVITLKGAGHLAIKTQPDEISKFIFEFLETDNLNERVG
ncbi:alpha/beta fold hydrolase [Bdellovibrio reynosensis]|uniref:Alpha/beta hydrolase n=1 Tax=Bdellovibrio reynosensis TaxID=2835041 RepID=A0ABY4CCJ6_9BACT|nr:alpha/beta hydrolase [Bdellovibrio reynosensis]UOF02692.1 alpha/beta hydrolase [Bdellovibrio reynosensis]